MRRKQSLFLGPAAVLTFGTLAACKPQHGQGSDPRTTERTVIVAHVEDAVHVDHHYTGVVGSRVESNLGFRVQGKIVERLVDAGEKVRRGQPLMRIDPTDYRHELIAQAGNVAAARARWVQAAADERRDRGLVATGAISRSAYDQVKAASDSAKAILDAAIAQERVAGYQEDYAAAAGRQQRHDHADPGGAGAGRCSRTDRASAGARGAARGRREPA